MKGEINAEAVGPSLNFETDLSVETVSDLSSSTALSTALGTLGALGGGRVSGYLPFSCAAISHSAHRPPHAQVHLRSEHVRSARPTPRMKPRSPTISPVHNLADHGNRHVPAGLEHLSSGLLTPPSVCRSARSGERTPFCFGQHDVRDQIWMRVASSFTHKAQELLSPHSSTSW